ncbi:PREDICTED: N-acetylated-alpha-linked acidic dipeptidase-like protein [Nanorana parkeri]|uniref:N-acetylated-alpha-linked acidic dipeptidase-like protein n=1 Tax=Nanorana parkeri TaxID=125878 RepID=UPI0008543C72|nr:PREDICTED: N-acetylated-alpha-linked acidic dipeptidase-like protein [Nanorana parkeri]
MNLWKIVGGVFGGCLILAIGLLIGHFGISKTPSWAKELSKDVDEKFISEFMKEVDNKRIEENLRILSISPHMATTAGDEETVRFMLRRWKDSSSGLDDAKEERYDVYLSFPDATKPNNVQIVSSSNSVTFTSLLNEENLTEDQKDPEVVKPFAAYAPAGNPKGKLVYANQGSLSDFQFLNQTLDLTGTIAIVRYGGVGRSVKAINAARFGVVGVIVYTDPKDINDGISDESQTYPHSWYMPPSGVERGSYSVDFGDFLTPYYPAKSHTYRRNESEITGLPPVPTQPIGFGDARTLICALGGSRAQASWQGSLSCEYNVGPGFRTGEQYSGSDVQVNVYNHQTIKSSANVMGLIRGSVEPDRYIMYGNHRDSWVHGAIDPSSGTAVMLEITRILGEKVKQGKWRPRRSIIFGSWGAEEFGLIGSTEFAEEYYSKLRDRTAAYINVDISVFANATLRAQGTPPVQNVIFTAAKQVSQPVSSLNVYDNWIRHFNRTSSIYGGLIPQLGTLGAGSDYAPFLHYLGITCMDLAFTYDRSKSSARIYPAYHTAFDTFDYTAKHIDPGFTSHQAVARTAGNVLLRLADSIILPLGPRDYVETLDSYYNTAASEFTAQLTARGISLVPLKTAIDRYRTFSEEINKIIGDLKNAEEDPLRVRMINDQLMLVERAFINHFAFPDKLYYSHIIWASRSSSVVTFPGIADAYSKAISTQLKEDWDQVHHHITVATTAIDNAASTLQVAASI